MQEPTEKDSCPITTAQATRILMTLRTLSSNQTKILKELEAIKLEDARKLGYRQSATTWFRVGAVAAAVAIFSGIAAVVYVITGKADIATLFKGF